MESVEYRCYRKDPDCVEVDRTCQLLQRDGDIDIDTQIERQAGDEDRRNQ